MSSSQPDQTYYSANIFDAVDYSRYITCKGTSITVYHPDNLDKPYWKHQDPEHNKTHLVPAGYRVEVLDALVGWSTLG